MERQDELISVLSWNILNEDSAVPKYFPWTDRECLKFAFRAPKQIVEMTAQSPDFICLQEIDQFRTYFSVQLSKHGYEGYFKQRTGSKTDGCAIFYNRDKYFLTTSVDIEYNDLANGRKAFTTENIAQIGIFGSPTSDDLIVVANTHLWWNPKTPEIREAQLIHLLGQISQLDVPPLTPVIVCGDFNSTFEQVQQMMDRSQSQLNLRSSYDFPKAFTKERYTTHTPHSHDEIDFIWHNNLLHPIQVMSIPPVSELKKQLNGTGLPSKTLPSDHLHLFIRFRKSNEKSVE
eukprot:TRINITY_DN6515_c0_g1_i3.p1 TRINITY_DN6515_c0_g1~~TRINITY_DN6515_c0_g1_i3.p1  ORF type:complete len:289 (-),score=63.57 TRINITY_DN6515_c0_g1_i3:44-910(-)